MSTAVATAPLDAIRAAQAGINGMIPRQENRSGIRYAWYALDDVHHQDLDAMTNGASGGRLQHLKWQPITKAQCWVRAGALGDNGASEVVARRNPDPTTRRPREEMYWKQPSSIVNSLVMLYGNRGLIDSNVLRFVDLDTFEALHLDAIFFPEAEDALPRTFRACEARILGQIEKLRQGKPSSPDGRAIPLAPAAIPSVIKIGEEMLLSLRQSAKFGRAAIDERHSDMERAATDNSGRYRGTYDDRERRLLEWLEITPRNAALEKIALDSNQLPAVIQQLANVVTSQANQQPQFDVIALGKAIGDALAEKMSPQKAEPEKPEPEKKAPLQVAPKAR